MTDDCWNNLSNRALWLRESLSHSLYMTEVISSQISSPFQGAWNWPEVCELFSRRLRALWDLKKAQITRVWGTQKIVYRQWMWPYMLGSRTSRWLREKEKGLKGKGVCWMSLVTAIIRAPDVFRKLWTGINTEFKVRTAFQRAIAYRSYQLVRWGNNQRRLQYFGTRLPVDLLRERSTVTWQS